MVSEPRMKTDVQYVCIHSSLLKVIEQEQGVIERIESYKLQKEILSTFGVEIDDKTQQYQSVSKIEGFKTSPTYYALLSDVVEFKKRDFRLDVENRLLVLKDKTIKTINDEEAKAAGNLRNQLVEVGKELTKISDRVKERKEQYDSYTSDLENREDELMTLHKQSMGALKTARGRYQKIYPYEERPINRLTEQGFAALSLNKSEISNLTSAIKELRNSIDEMSKLIVIDELRIKDLEADKITLNETLISLRKQRIATNQEHTNIVDEQERIRGMREGRGACRSSGRI